MKNSHIVVLRTNRVELAFWPERDANTHAILEFANTHAAEAFAAGRQSRDEQATFFVATLEEL